MVTVSEEEYRALEAKIHTEVRKIFSDFLRDLEQQRKNDAAGIRTKSIPKPGQATVPVQTLPPTIDPRRGKYRAARKSLEVRRFLEGAKRTGKKITGKDP